MGYYDVHKAGFIHRDIKPANIFHKNGVYKIGDFGFTIPYQDLAQHRSYNVGSPVYMPPEALKDNLYSISCDTWAIGVMFYQMLRGVVPWRAISEQVLYDKIMNEPIQGIINGLPTVAKEFLSHVLCVDPNRRMTPDQFVDWPAKLAAASIEIQRSISPHDFSNRSNQALKEIKNLSLGPKNLIPPSFHIASVISPAKYQQNNENRPPPFFMKEIGREKEKER